MVRVSFLIKSQFLGLQLYLKGDSGTVFSKFCEISKNKFFTEFLRTTASRNNFLFCSLHKRFQPKVFTVVLIKFHGLKLLTSLYLDLVTYLNTFSVIVLNKFLCVEKISNVETISSSIVPYFLKKDKSSSIKFVILTRPLIDQNEKSLCYTLHFGKENVNHSKNAHILNATRFK